MVKYKKVIIITNMHTKTRQYSIFTTLAIAVCFLLSSANVFALTESISNPYKTATTIKVGSVVSLSTTEQNEVVPANTTNGQRLVGVTVTNQQSVLAVNDANNTTQVVSSGVAETLVSTINGSISIGSQVSVSPLSGVAEGDDPGERVVGIAEAAFNSSTSGAVSQSVYDTGHHLHTIYVGYIPVLIAVNSDTTNNSNGGFINSYRSLLSNFAGRTVSNTVLLLVALISVITLVTIIVLIYGAITAGLISLGRNPLAKGSILASVGQIFLMVLVVAAISITIIYFILH